MFIAEHGNCFVHDNTWLNMYRQLAEWSSIIRHILQESVRYMEFLYNKRWIYRTIRLDNYRLFIITRFCHPTVHMLFLGRGRKEISLPFFLYTGQQQNTTQYQQYGLARSELYILADEI